MHKCTKHQFSTFQHTVLFSMNALDIETLPFNALDFIRKLLDVYTIHAVLLVFIKMFGPIS